MPVDVVSALTTAFSLAEFIRSTIQSIETSKEQLQLLSVSADAILTTLNKEFAEARLLPDKCADSLVELEVLLQEILRFVESEKDAGFMKILLMKDVRMNKMDAFHKRIETFISSLVDVRSMLAENQQAQIRDTEALHTYLASLERNNAKLLRTLEINQNNTISMMVSIQKQLNSQNVDRLEQRFYTHALAYLTSRSGGKVVKVEDWMVPALEVEYHEEIGAGGFDTRTWNRTEVAIKILQNEAGIKPRPASLRSEIDIWSTLRHPNIVQFLGANTLDDKPFIIMPYIPYNARDFLRERPAFDPLYILLDISLGLEYVHLLKICHGDLKGLNVLVEHSGRALLCDFGLARLKADTTSRTSSRDSLQIQGSRNWMAPELLNGARPRPPSDIYAFSMTLYELFTDEIPLFTVGYGDLVDLVVRRNGRPERPYPGEGRPISDEVWALAEWCWAADPLERPTATQLHDSIKQMLSRPSMNPFLDSTETLEAVEGSVSDEGDSPSESDEPETSDTSPSSSALDVQLDMATTYDDHLDTGFANQSWELGAKGFCRLAELQNTFLLDKTNALGEDHPDTICAALNLAATYHRLGLFDRAAELQLNAVERRKSSLGPLNSETLDAMCNLAATYRNLGRLEEALTIGQHVLHGRIELFGEMNLKTMSALHGVGLTYFGLKRYEEAETVQLGILTERKRLLGKRHNETLIAMECLALTCNELGQVERAGRLAQKVIVGRRRLLGKDHPHTVASVEMLAPLRVSVPESRGSS
ncbi:kinase-like protein [Favolaschia claudopus]|uniref:Kinase-like protein n=1 Tax=Favolaschia claudopus TaxID=2862362 RepID=A0AAW0D4G1_9AGAR